MAIRIDRAYETVTVGFPRHHAWVCLPGLKGYAKFSVTFRFGFDGGPNSPLYAVSVGHLLVDLFELLPQHPCAQQPRYGGTPIHVRAPSLVLTGTPK